MRAPIWLAFAWLALAGAQQSPPVFRADVELFTIRVLVAAARGKDLPKLTPDQFDVRTNGHKRTLTFAELVRTDDGLGISAPPSQGSGTAPTASDDGFFQRFPGQKSAMYILGLEATGERTPAVSVKVKVKDVAVRRWAWCMAATRCGPDRR